MALQLYYSNTRFVYTDDIDHKVFFSPLAAPGATSPRHRGPLPPSSEAPVQADPVGVRPLSCTLSSCLVPPSISPRRAVGHSRNPPRSAARLAFNALLHGVLASDVDTSGTGEGLCARAQATRRALRTLALPAEPGGPGWHGAAFSRACWAATQATCASDCGGGALVLVNSEAELQMLLLGLVIGTPPKAVSSARAAKVGWGGEGEGGGVWRCSTELGRAAWRLAALPRGWSLPPVLSFSSHPPLSSPRPWRGPGWGEPASCAGLTPAPPAPPPPPRPWEPWGPWGPWACLPAWWLGCRRTAQSPRRRCPGPTCR